MSWYLGYRPTRPLATDQGIKARHQRGKLVANWWAERWLAALERLMNPGRLARGRRYARGGQVLDLKETRHGVAAKVQGSRPTPYKVTIDIAPLPDAAWTQVFDALAEQAGYVAELLAGQLPPEIEDVFTAADASLFPDQPGDLDAACSCPDPDPLCKHIAATYYLLAERLDDEPWLLFRLRGRTEEQTLAALRERQGADEPDEEQADDMAAANPALADMLDDYWRAGSGLERFETRVAAPAVRLPILKRLGPASFTEVDIASRLGAAYAAMSRRAQDVDAGEVNGAAADF